MKLLPTLLLLLAAGPAFAKLPAERWTRLTEEERHQLTRAEKYVDQKDYKSALPEYELFLQLYTRSEIASYAQLMFAECTRQTGQVNTAINEFRNVIDYFPDSIDAGYAQYSIGACQSQAGDAELAVKSFEKVVEKWPKEEFGALARRDACAIYWRLNQVDKWLPHMEYLATGEYKDTENLRHLSQRRLLMHRLVEGKMPEALAAVGPLKTQDPLVTCAHWTADALQPNELPTIYGDKGKKDLPNIANAAVAFIEKQAAQMADPSQRPTLDQWYARILSRGGVAEKATARYAELVKKNPDSDPLRAEYAAHLRAMKNYAEARLIYHDLKDQYTADREIAETYGEERNWKSCVEAYQAMLGKHADKAGAIQWQLGNIQQSIGKYQEAIAAYQQSNQEPQSLIRISECQGSMKQHDAAIQTLTSVINFFKTSAPEAQYRIAGQQAAKGDKDSAIRTLKAVCKNYLNSSWAGRAHQDLSSVYGVDVTTGGAAKKKEE